MKHLYALASGLAAAILLSGCMSVSSVYGPEKVERTDFFEPKLETESLRFFLAGRDGLEKKFRVYNETFRHGASEWVWYELTVRNLSQGDTRMKYTEVWLDGNNAVLNSAEKEMKMKKTDLYFEYCAGLKTEWTPGYYVLKLYQDSLKLAEKEFRITEIK